MHSENSILSLFHQNKLLFKRKKRRRPRKYCNFHIFQTNCRKVIFTKFQLRKNKSQFLLQRSLRNFWNWIEFNCKSKCNPMIDNVSYSVFFETFTFHFVRWKEINFRIKTLNDFAFLAAIKSGRKEGIQVFN